MATLDGSTLVLCVPRTVVARLIPRDGFRAIPREHGPTFLGELLQEATWEPRTEDLEHGPGGAALKQVIPYATLWMGSRLFCYRRPPKGGDPRLASGASLGLGGHVHPDDAAALRATDHAATLDQALRRELAEEVGLTRCPAWPVGLLNDDSNPVGERHVGVVYAGSVDSSALAVDRAEVHPLGWWEPERVRRAATAPELAWETWSRQLMPYLETIASLIVR